MPSADGRPHVHGGAGTTATAGDGGVSGGGDTTGDGGVDRGVGATGDTTGDGGVGATGDATVGIPPAVTEETRPFWDAAAEGRLLAERCQRCGAEHFPPRGICRRCRARTVEPVEVTGPGVVHSYTVNHQRWLPDLAVPYALVLVEFPDHPGVRVLGRLRGCEPTAVTIGLEVAVGFEAGPGGSSIPSFVARTGGEER